VRIGEVMRLIRRGEVLLSAHPTFQPAHNVMGISLQNSQTRRPASVTQNRKTTSAFALARVTASRHPFGSGRGFRALHTV